MTATSTEQSTESSCAFLNSPPLRLRKVRAVPVVLDGLYLNLPSTHYGDCLVLVAQSTPKQRLATAKLEYEVVGRRGGGHL
jgi:hypothetical protein